MNYYFFVGLVCAISIIHAADIGVLIKPEHTASTTDLIICVENDRGLFIGPAYAELTKDQEDYIWITPTYWLWLPDGMRRRCISYPVSTPLLHKIADNNLFEKLFDAEQSPESRCIWLSFVIKLLILRLPFCKHDLPIMTSKELPVFFGRRALGLPSFEQLDAVARYLFHEELLSTLIEIEDAYWSDIVRQDCDALDAKTACEMENYIHRTPYQNVLGPLDSYIKDYPLTVGAQLKWKLYDNAIEAQQKKEAILELILFAEEAEAQVALHYLRIIFEWLISKQYVPLPPPLERISRAPGGQAAAGSTHESAFVSGDEHDKHTWHSEKKMYRLVDTVYVLGGKYVSEYKARLELIKPAFQFGCIDRIRFWGPVFNDLIGMYSKLARSHAKQGVTYQAETELYLIKKTVIIGFVHDNQLVAPKVKKLDESADQRCAIL
jgi:hypothetical protein